jgi:hypothetical protein
MIMGFAFVERRRTEELPRGREVHKRSSLFEVEMEGVSRELEESVEFEDRVWRLLERLAEGSREKRQSESIELKKIVKLARSLLE